MDSFQVKNLKSIEDSGVIDIKPITVFVGRNSSGKSSLIRCFPLFKQSCESKILGTVLWSGKYVDYGSFDESLNFNISADSIKEISFSFRFTLLGQNARAFLSDGTVVGVNIDVHGDEYSKTSYTNLTYRIYGNEIFMRVTSDLRIITLTINGVDFTKSCTELYRVYKAYSVIPVLFSGAIRSSSQFDSSYGNLTKELRDHVHHRTSDERIKMVARSLRFSDDEGIKKMLSNKTLMGDFAASKISKWDLGNQKLKNIKDQIIFANLEKILDQISDNVRSHFLSSRYITPLRAAADRYYRIQNTSIEELDPNGSNLAMFLHAKKETEIDEINQWLREQVGFAIKVVSSHGHASIFILDEDNGKKSNIADTGFGISQILPVLIQVWQLSKRKSRALSFFRTPVTVIIEQPELHLHPKMQSRIGDVFCKAVKLARQNDVILRIIIETHSKDIVDSIGRAIEGNVITQADAAVYIVNKAAGVEISRSGFDDGGFLQQWPYGFFDGT